MPIPILVFKFRFYNFLSIHSSFFVGNFAKLLKMKKNSFIPILLLFIFSAAAGQSTKNFQFLNNQHRVVVPRV